MPLWNEALMTGGRGIISVDSCRYNIIYFYYTTSLLSLYLHLPPLCKKDLATMSVLILDNGTGCMPSPSMESNSAYISWRLSKDGLPGRVQCSLTRFRLARNVSSSALVKWTVKIVNSLPRSSYFCCYDPALQSKTWLCVFSMEYSSPGIPRGRR